jgi:protein-tyrosine phosphatase
VERRIELDGCVNFRDLGGYPTADGRVLRWRRVFRADALHDLSVADVVRLKIELGLSDIVDLRSSAELAAEGRGRLADESIAFHHRPLFDGDTVRADRDAARMMTLGERYVGLLELARPQIARVIRVLAEADGAAVFHCAAGKDRTGVISAVLLGVLGVSDELIVSDYARSADQIDAIIDRVMSMKGYEEALDEMPADTLHAKPESMEAVVAHVTSRYGTMSDYLRASDVDDGVLERLRTKYLE